MSDSRRSMRWEEVVVYALVLAGIYGGTFLGTIPGVDAAWTILGVRDGAAPERHGPGTPD